MMIVRAITITFVLLLIWQAIVWLFQLPPYILPSPYQVLLSGYQNINLITTQSVPTLIEILLGFLLGSLLGISTALMMTLLQPLRLWLLPMLIISQAIPTFAIAPLLVVWLGYGMASKIATTIIMLFFPVTSAFFDGLKRKQRGWLDLAHTMGANRLRSLWFILIPAALPALATGLRVAAAIAPIGAVVGEWVGASQGLGFLMLNANARMQIALMFAVLFIIMILALLLYFSVDKVLRWLLPWAVSNEP